MIRSLVVSIAALLCACGASDPPPPPPAAPPPATLPAVGNGSVMPPGAPGAPLSMGTMDPAPVAPTTPPPTGIPPVPSPPPAAGTDRCEGLVGPCGGWLGCVMVRADATTPGRFVGTGPNAGHFYAENHQCFGGVCNEVCTGGSLSMCRPGVAELAGPIACSAAMPPSVAPFTCAMVAGTCVQGPDPSMIPRQLSRRS